MQAAIVRTMKTPDFNAEAAPAAYGYRSSPVNPRAFQFTRLDEDAREPAIVGDYTILDKNEDVALAEKKVMNLVSLLNGRKNLMQLGHETSTRVLYKVVTECDDDGKTRIVFYNLGREGVSVENALFRIEKEIYHA
jgi:hypothetical protein